MKWHKCILRCSLHERMGWFDQGPGWTIVEVLSLASQYSVYCLRERGWEAISVALSILWPAPVKIQQIKIICAPPSKSFLLLLQVKCCPVQIGTILQGSIVPTSPIKIGPTIIETIKVGLFKVSIQYCIVFPRT